MTWSGRGSAAAADSSMRATAALSLSVVVIGCSMNIILEAPDISQDGNDLAFRESAPERRHGAGLAIPDARDDKFVAAFGACQLRPLAFGAAAVLVAIAAQGREHGGAIDVVGRCLGRPGLRFGGRTRTLLRRTAADRQRKHQHCERRAIARDRYPHCRRGATGRKAVRPPILLLLECEHEQGAGVLRHALEGLAPQRCKLVRHQAAPAGRYRNVLLAASHVADDAGVVAHAVIVRPQFLSGFGVVGVHNALAVRNEQQIAAGGENTGERRFFVVDLPLLLTGYRVAGLEPARRAEPPA